MVETDVPAAAFDLMARDLQQVIKNEGAEEGLGEQTELLYKIANIVGEQAVKEYEAQSLQGYVSLSTIPQLVKPLAFSDVKLKWSPQHTAFYNEGRLGVSHIGKNDINGGFEGFMEIRKTAEGVTVFHVFFKASPESWYYLGIEDNRLFLHSSNKDFNSMISKRSNAGKAKIGEVAFVPGSEEETLAFINRFRKQYLEIDVPYSLYEAPPVESSPTIETAPPVNNKPPQEQQKPVTEPSVEPGKQQPPKEKNVEPEQQPVRKDPEPAKEQEEKDDGF